MYQLYRYRDLILTLVGRELKVRYRRSMLGFVWTMLQPLMTMVVLRIVFGAVFRFDIHNYPVYALAGILFWNFFNQSVVSSMNSLRGNAEIIKKVAVPTEIFPLTMVISGVVNLLLALIPLLLILVATGHPVRVALLFLPVSILLAAVFTLGAGLLLSPLAAMFSDVVELVSVAMTMLMYLTPIFYPMAILPENLRWIVRFNPLRSVLEVFRDPIYHGKIPPLSHLTVVLTVAVGALVIGVICFRRLSGRIPFYV
jgi:ABC-2 type transport system permease protein